jgi:long-chain acyl-CoA synthetase
MTFNPVERLREFARTRSDKPAISGRGETLSYSHFDQRANQVAQGLTRLGVSRGDRVSYLGRNRPEFFEIAFGCAKIGAVLAPLNWRLTAPEISALVVDAGSSVMFAEPGAEPTFAFSGDGHVLLIGSTYEGWRDKQSTADPGLVTEPGDDFIQFYTSGTTGLPKGVIVRNKNMELLFRAGSRWRLDADSVVAVIMPLFHMGGSAWALVALLSGAHCVMQSEFDPKDTLDMVESEKVTTILLAPSMLQMMVAVPDAADRDYSQLQSVVYGSAPISMPLLRSTMATFNAPLIQLFGLTETTGAIIQLDPEDHREELLSSIGRPYEWAEVQVQVPVRKCVSNQHIR